MKRFITSLLILTCLAFADSRTVMYPNYTAAKAENDTLSENYLKFLELVSKGNALHDNGLFEDALACYRTADSLYPGTYLTLYEIAFTYLKLNKRDSTIYYARKSIAVEPYENSFSMIGDCFDEAGQLDSAIKYYDMGLQSFPLSYLLMYNKAVALNNYNRGSEALDVLKQSILVTKRHEGSYFLASELAYQRYQLVEFFADGSYSTLIGDTKARKHRFVDNFQVMYNYFVNEERNALPLNVHDAFAHNFVYRLKMAIMGDEKLEELIKSSEYEKMVQVGIFAVREAAKSNYKYSLKPFFQSLVDKGVEETYCRYVFKTMDEIGFKSWIMMNPQKVKAFASLFETYWDEEL